MIFFFLLLLQRPKEDGVVFDAVFSLMRLVPKKTLNYYQVRKILRFGSPCLSKKRKLTLFSVRALAAGLRFFCGLRCGLRP